MQIDTAHSFHIPVMGLAYTIDTPIKVARYGINSVISIIQDNLVEKMRSHYYKQLDEPYHPISIHEPDYRAKRITDYLNLVNTLVQKQFDDLKKSPFESGSEITKYFEMLPESSPLKQLHTSMLSLPEGEAKFKMQNTLRESITPGSIDVNIMTKLDKTTCDSEGQLIEDGSDAVSALRGYAMSTVTNSSVILSAGMNPRLFAYMEKLDAFDADEHGVFQKKIVIKVSDYRSALIQGKMLAKRGLWVSEFRIESGLNCGGHAFATDGFLIGPILEEFKNKKEELRTTMFSVYNDTLKAKGKVTFERTHTLKITVQGGIGTQEEDELLRQYYEMDGTGWGTPFLLVPEATTVDDETLSLLSKAQEKDVVLSKNSPLGVRFHYLKGTSGERDKLKRIAEGKPGSPCHEKFLVFNTEFSTEPICTASRTYQRKKIEQLKSLDLPETEYQKQYQEVVDKECLCVGLSNAAVSVYNLKHFTKKEGTNICPGPNIAYFSEIVSLQKMVDHIYGRTNVITRDDRPHMFIKELTLYVDYWSELLTETREAIDNKRKNYIEGFHKNLLEGISYYRQLSNNVSDEFGSLKDKLDAGLNEVEKKLNDSLSEFLSNLMVHA